LEYLGDWVFRQTHHSVTPPLHEFSGLYRRGTLAFRARPSAQLRKAPIGSSRVAASGTPLSSARKMCCVLSSQRSEDATYNPLMTAC